MKKLILYTNILLLIAFIFSCSPSPSDAFVGKWEEQKSKTVITFNADGTVNDPEGKEGKWELVEEDQLILKIYKKEGKLENELIITFLSNDEVEWQSKKGNDKGMLKRIE